MLIPRVRNLPKTDWAYKEGVFMIPSGEYIARIKMKGQKNGRFITLSKHKTIEEAKEAINKFYNKK